MRPWLVALLFALPFLSAQDLHSQDSCTNCVRAYGCHVSHQICHNRCDATYGRNDNRLGPCKQACQQEDARCVKSKIDHECRTRCK